MYIYIYMYMYVYTYLYIYIYKYMKKLHVYVYGGSSLTLRIARRTTSISPMDDAKESVENSSELRRFSAVKG